LGGYGLAATPACDGVLCECRHIQQAHHATHPPNKIIIDWGHLT
jgi:hypothetical protein